MRFQDGAWIGFAPRAGWLAFVVDEADLYLFDGSGWTSFRKSLTALQDLVALGVGTGADAANPFAAKLNAALWTARAPAEGGSGDLRVAFGKASAANVLSLQFQDAYSTRAEFGLLGEDALSLKVSADGAAWHGAWRTDPATGYLGLGSVAAAGAPVPVAPLHVAQVGGTPILQLETYDPVGAPVININARIGRGTITAPAPIRSGDRFFGFFGRGFHAGGDVSANMVGFNSFAEEDFTATGQGTGIDFQVTDTGTTVRRSTVRFRANGSLELLARPALPTTGLRAGQIVFDGPAGAFRGYGNAGWSRMTNLPRFAAALGADALLPGGTWTRVPFNAADTNDQGVFSASAQRFTAAEAGVYAFGAALAYRRSGSASPTAFQARFHRNGASAGRARAAATALVDGVSALGLTTALSLQAGDTVEVFALFTGGDGFVAAADTGFWGRALA